MKIDKGKLNIILKLCFVVGILVLAADVIFGYISEKNYINIDFEEFTNKIENEETFPILIVKDDCIYCEAFIPKVKKVSKKYNVDIYYINLSEISDAEYILFDSTYSISGTPTLFFINDGEETYSVNRIIGNKSESDLIEKLKVNDYIK